MRLGASLALFVLSTVTIACVHGGPAGHGAASSSQQKHDSPHLGFESKDYDWRDYMGLIYPMVFHSWYDHLFSQARAGVFSTDQSRRGLKSLRGSCILRVTIQKDGTLHDPELTGPSSLDGLNTAVLEMIKELRFPPLPKDFPRNAERLDMGFILEAESEEQLLLNIKAMRAKGIL